jgi:hypothetical protein
MLKISRLSFFCVVLASLGLHAQVEVSLTKNFVRKYADRATITTDFRVDVSSRIHPQKDDGDIHIAGTSNEIGLPAVAEIMNAAEEKNDAVKRLKQIEGTGQTLALGGAWRIWPEHGGEPEKQGETVDPLDSSGVAHVFEIHPVTSIDGRSITATWHPIDNYRYKDPETAFNAYERTHSHISVSATRVTITTDVVTYNYPRFLIQLTTTPKEFAAGDGYWAYAKIFSADRDLLVTKRRIIFVKGTPAAATALNKHKGDYLDVVGIPRINLRLIQWRIENYNKPDWKAKKPLDWNLPYELVIAAVTDDNPPSE